MNAPRVQISKPNSKIVCSKATSLITTKHLYKLYGNFLSGEGMKIYYINNQEIDNLSSIAQNIRPHYTVTAFGGGKVIDAARYIASQASCEYDVIPTTLSNDGICSPMIVLKQKDGFQFRKEYECPSHIFISMDIIKQAPIETIQSGLGDLISNHSALQDWLLSHEKTGENIDYISYHLAGVSYQWLWNHARILFGRKFLYDDEMYVNLIQGLIFSGLAMEVYGSSRPCSGGEHLFAHALELQNPDRVWSHGYLVAFGTLITEYLRHGKDKMEKMKTILMSLGLPMSYVQLGIEKKKLVNAIEYIPKLNPHKYTIFHDKQMTRQIIKEVLDIIK